MSPTAFLTIAGGITIAVNALALLIVLWRAASTHNDARRAVLSDMVFFAMVGLFLSYCLFHRSAITYDVVMFAGLFGALTTIAYARIITRGRR
ncbi:cation:proton antiporter [Corynebacterium bovis]|uniref:cation:proton antiporter n=1 Tax=Corynebacterium bovis TaxID=36808 RepID=UPI003138A8E7